MQTCAANGRLLQPDKPMTVIDAVLRASIPGEREVSGGNASLLLTIISSVSHVKRHAQFIKTGSGQT
jgi:hypothetical protein